MRLLIIFLASIIFQSAFGQTNNQKAIEIIDQAIKATGKVPESLKITGKGVIHNLGHYDIPEKTIDIPVEEMYAYFPKLEVVYSRSEIQRNNRAYVSSTVSKSDSVYSIGYYDREYSKKKNFDAWVEAAKTNPVWFLNMARQSAASLRFSEETPNTFRISALMPNHQVFDLVIDKNSNLLTAIESVAYSNLYGDGIYSTQYLDYKPQSGTQIPTKRIESEFGRVEKEINYEAFDFTTAPDTTHYRLIWLPHTFLNSLTKEPNTDETFTFQAISNDIDLIKIESQNNKSLLVKMKDGFALFEVPQGIKLNQELQQAISERYPSQKLKYLFLTHHHPDHAGGLRAYSELPLEVITTEGNKAYFNKLLKTKHKLSGSIVSDEVNLKLEYVPIDGSKDFLNKKVTAYEIGKNTDHSLEHLVFYFPQEKILWTGDLLFFYENGYIYPAGKRGGSVYDVIINNKLDVERIYTAWPLRNQKEYGTVEFLKKLVETK